MNKQLAEAFGRLSVPGGNSKVKRAALIGAGLSLINVLLYGALVAPSSARLADQESRYSELRKRHAEAVLFQKHKKDFGGFLAGVPTQKDMPLLIKDLSVTARRLGLSVAAVNYDIPKRAEGGLTMLAFSFPVEGSYPGIKRFIHEIETSDALVGIQDVKFDADQGRVKMQLKLVTYIKGDES